MSKSNADDRSPIKPALPRTPSPAPVVAPGADSLKTQMPTGEIGVRHAPGLSLASDSGGTSKTEDTPRAAGYVADLTKANEPPPGPPVAKSPEDFAGPDSTAVPPKPLTPTGATGPGPNLRTPARSEPAVAPKAKKPHEKRSSRP